MKKKVNLSFISVIIISCLFMFLSCGNTGTTNSENTSMQNIEMTPEGLDGTWVSAESNRTLELPLTNALVTDYGTYTRRGMFVWKCTLSDSNIPITYGGFWFTDKPLVDTVYLGVYKMNDTYFDEESAIIHFVWKNGKLYDPQNNEYTKKEN